MSSADMVALMNNTNLLMASSVNGSVMATGANRDIDGTIDRTEFRVPCVSPSPTLRLLGSV